MQKAWVVVVGLAEVCAGCALDEQLDDGGDEDVAIAKKALPACKTKKKDKPKKKESDCYTTTSVGATGGVVEHPGGVTLSVPAGALDHDVAISVRDEGAPGPAGTQMFSPVFTFEPDGTLARPVQVQFDVGTQDPRPTLPLTDPRPTLPSQISGAWLPEYQRWSGDWRLATSDYRYNSPRRKRSMISSFSGVRDFSRNRRIDSSQRSFSMAGTSRNVRSWSMVKAWV